MCRAFIAKEGFSWSFKNHFKRLQELQEMVTPETYFIEIEIEMDRPNRTGGYFLDCKAKFPGCDHVCCVDGMKFWVMLISCQ